MKSVLLGTLLISSLKMRGKCQRDSEFDSGPKLGDYVRRTREKMRRAKIVKVQFPSKGPYMTWHENSYVLLFLPPLTSMPINLQV